MRGEGDKRKKKGETELVRIAREHGIETDFAIARGQGGAWAIRPLAGADERWVGAEGDLVRMLLDHLVKIESDYLEHGIGRAHCYGARAAARALGVDPEAIIKIAERCHVVTPHGICRLTAFFGAEGRPSLNLN